MKLWSTLLALTLLSPLVAMALPSDPTDMISWEIIRGKPDGGANRLTVWADGRSEIVLQRGGDADRPKPKLKPGWAVSHDGTWWVFRKPNALSSAEAKQKFAAARAAGIEELKTFTNFGKADLGQIPTRVRMQFNGRLKETTIPEFMNKGEKDNLGSENHRRFLEIEKIFGRFDIDASEESP